MDGGNVNSRSRCVSTATDRNNNNNNNMIIDQIMLRFRPIAPRPVTAERSGNALPVMRKRVKRKYVRVKKTKKNKKKMMNDVINWFDLDRTVAVTVMDPDYPDPLQSLQKVTNWISFDTKGVINNNDNDLFICKPPRPSDLHGVDLAVAVSNREVAESWITLKMVTGTCEDRRMFGYTDEEIMRNLKADTCPGFISNGFGYDEVRWVNPAYQSMVNVDSNLAVSDSSEVVVWLVVKVDKLSVEKYLPAFSCRVRIEYQSSDKKSPLTVPCDVCKMNSGEFAWRLDVKFALSLGPLN
ncbi:uncharacterized protein LOC143628671 [Bidens hawaiensis]|uniref:uncharacterized protein LOC143628671 n=1 Tax=Bidens hawaiensis TaxID=980011 RepID=UPI004049D675